DLRARTLDLVKAVGRPRDIHGADADLAGAPPVGVPRTRRPRWAFGVPRGRFALAALGAAAVFALLAAGSFVAADLQAQLERTHQEAARLHELYGDIETVLQAPAARSVALLASDGQPGGAVVLDVATKQIAVLSDDLT